MNEAVELARANPLEEDQVVALVRTAYAPYIERIGKEPAPMSADYGAAIAAGQVVVARRVGGHTPPVTVSPAIQGEVLGLIVTETFTDHLLIENIAVSPAAQGFGVGGMLLEHAYAEARALGIAEVRLYTNAKMTENLSYYPRRGFVEVDRRRESGFDRVYFARSVSE